MGVIFDRRLFIVAALAIPINSVSGAEWIFNKGIGLGVVYTDNVNFEPPGTASTETLSKLSPYFDLNSAGKRTISNLSVEADYLSYSELEEERINARVSSNIRSEIIRDAFFSGAFLNFRRANTSEDSLIDDPLSASGETNNVWSGGFDLTFDKDISTSDQLYINYAFDFLENSSSLEDDSTNHNINSRWNRIVNSQKTALEFSADSRRTEFSGSDEWIAIHSISGRLVHLLNREVTIEAAIGVDNTSSSLAEPSVSTGLWNVGLAWQPNTRNQFKVTYGERAFGQTPGLQYQFTGRRLSVNTSWSRDYANTGLAGTQTGGPGFADNSQQSDPENSVTGAQDAEHLLLNGLNLIDDTVALGISLSGRLTEISANASYIRRENLLDSTQIEGSIFSAALSRKITRYASWELVYEYRNETPEETNVTTESNKTSLSINIDL